jgi:hypothetical protein
MSILEAEPSSILQRTMIKKFKKRKKKTMNRLKL